MYLVDDEYGETKRKGTPESRYYVYLLIRMRLLQFTYRLAKTSQYYEMASKTLDENIRTVLYLIEDQMPHCSTSARTGRQNQQFQLLY